MKQQIPKVLGLMTLALTLGLCISAPAKAADYTGDCAGIAAFNGSGSVLITQDEDCSISQDVTASGNIRITSNSGFVHVQKLTATTGDVRLISGTSDITSQDLKAGNSVGLFATSSSGSITVSGNVTNNLNQTAGGTGAWDVHGNILVQSYGNVSIGNINTGGDSGSSSVKTGAVQIDANMGGGNTTFVIGGSGSNAVGTISTASTTGGGDIYTKVTGGVAITNGTASSTGGIQLASMSSINVQASQSHSGWIMLNARNGQITLPTGTLSSDGASGQAAGVIYLIGSTVDLQDATIISASQDSSAPPSIHQVILSAQTVKMRGSSGLEVHADGNGIAGGGLADVFLLPQGSIQFVSNGQLNSLDWQIQSTVGLLTKPGTLNIDGSQDGSPLLVSANGDYAGAYVSGYPLNFTGGAVTIQSNGATSHEVKVGYYGTMTGTTGLTIGNTDVFTVDASGKNGDGGNLEINTDGAAINPTSFVVKSNGPDSGNGNGGTVTIKTSSLTLNSSTPGTVSSDGSSAGTGNGGSITLDPGTSTINVGSAPGRVAFSPKGGNTSGNGGLIHLKDVGGPITVYDASATTSSLDVSVPGSSGDGGTINVKADGGLTFDGTASYLKADSSATSGAGGQIILDVTGSVVTVSTGTANSVDLSAKSVTSGDGGLINITSPSGITVDAAHVAVNGAADGKGGTIELDATGGALSLTGQVAANGGSGNGAGGVLNFTADSLTLPGDSNTNLAALGYGTGAGGQVSLDIAGPISVANGNGSVSVAARNLLGVGSTSNGNGNGGAVTITAAGELDLYGAAVVVDGGLKGGSIDATATGTNNIVVSGQIEADGGTNGDGGSVQLTANGITLPEDVNTVIGANGFGTGKGGSVTLTTTAEDVTISGDNGAASLKAKSNGSGAGGSITVTSGGQLTANGTAVDVSVTSGTGQGGSITLNSASNDMNLSGQFSANGGSDGGAGGVLVVNGGTLNLPGDSNTNLAALGYSTGAGGAINMNIQGPISIANGNGTVSFAARNLDSVGSTLNGNGNGGSVTINSDGELDLYGAAVVVDGGINGGTIFASASNLVLSGEFHADAGADGNGGLIKLTGDSLNLPADENTPITVNGNGSGNGGQIYIVSHGVGIDVSSDTQAVSLQAMSNGSGNGGSVSITDTNVVLLNGASLNVSAGSTASSGAGGSISITGSQITVTGTLIADGVGTGFPGTITLHQTGGTDDMVLDGATISASGDPAGDASGHEIDIASLVGISMNNAILKANASTSGTGTGGSVHITNVNQIDLSSAHISAIGADSGDGGVVVISSTSNFHVNEIIKVNGSPTIDPTHFDGSITLNNVTCQQWSKANVYHNWPYTYWDCANPTNPSAGDQVVPDTAFGNINPDRKAELASNNVQLYVMSNGTKWKQFFSQTADISNTGGYSISGAGNLISTAFVSITGSSGGTAANSYMSATTAHELGHQLDYIWGSVSSNPAWTTARNNDLTKTDPGYISHETSCSAVFSNTICNNPLYSGHTPVEILSSAYGIDKNEMFARMFEHLQTNSSDPDLESVLEFLPEMKAYMLSAISSGTHP